MKPSERIEKIYANLVKIANRKRLTVTSGLVSELGIQAIILFLDEQHARNVQYPHCKKCGEFIKEADRHESNLCISCYEEERKLAEVS